MALVAQQQGVDEMKLEKIQFICEVIRQRGISESPYILDKAAAAKLMLRLEQRAQVPHKYEFGFGGSEALVKMIRCPNNTFPIFWYTDGKNRSTWPAPFPRH